MTPTPSDALRALEPATRDANAFKARSALIAMRAIVARAGADADALCAAGAASAWPHVFARAASAQDAVRADAVATLEAFVAARCVRASDAVARLGSAWTRAHWRARESALKVFSGTLSRGCAREDDAREMFKRACDSMGDRESAVRDAAFACASAARAAFPEATAEEFELARNDLRPQHAKALERLLTTTTTTTTATTATECADDVPLRSTAAAVVADGLVPPPPERISNEHELKRAMHAAARDLHPEQDWLKRIAAMVRLEAIALGGGSVAFEDAFTSSLGKAKEAITAQVNDRRSAVVKQASHLLAALARHATASFEPYAEHFIMALLKTTVITVGVIAESGDAGIKGIIAHCQSPKVVMKLSAAAREERAPKARACAVEYLSLILQTWDLNKKYLECIGDALQTCISDADATVRNNAKACVEILSETSPTSSSRDGFARVDSKLSGSAQDVMSMDSASEVTSDQRGGRAQRDTADEHASVRDRSRSASRATRRLGGASRVAPVPVDDVPAPAPSRPTRDVFTAIEFAEHIERAGNRAGRVEASARLRDALDASDARIHGSQAARFEAQATKRVAKIVKLLLAYAADANELVCDAALESMSTLAYVARDEFRPSLPSACSSAFERLVDAREATRALAAECLASFGDVYEPNALAPALLCALKGASTARVKTGVLEFALYVFCGRGGGSGEVAFNPASVTTTIEAWIDMVCDMVSDIDETMAKAAAANLAAIHSHVDGAVVPRRVNALYEYSARVRFMDAVERRAPKLAQALQSLVDLQEPPIRAEPKVTRTPHGAPKSFNRVADDVDDDDFERDGFENQNVASFMNGASYESMYVEATTTSTSPESPNVGIGQRIVRALEDMRDDDEARVVRGLLAVARAASSDVKAFTPYLALVAPRACAALNDSRSIVAAHAVYVMRSIFERDGGMRADDAAVALAPLLNDASAAAVAPLTCVRMMVSHASTRELEGALPKIIRAIVAACESDHVAVRQLAVRVLGACQSTLGQAWMAPYVEALPPSRQTMITHFAAAA